MGPNLQGHLADPASSAIAIPLIGAESLRVDVSRAGYWCLVFYPAAIIRATWLRVGDSCLAAGELAQALGALEQALLLHLVQGALLEHIFGACLLYTSPSPRD